MTPAASLDPRPFHERAARAREQVELLRTQLAAAQRTVHFWEALAAYVEGERWAAAFLLLLRDADALRCQGDAGFLEALGAEMEARARGNAAAFASVFPAELVEAGLTLDTGARHPRYTLHDGFLRVDVDEAALTATVTPRNGTPSVLGMDVAPLVETLRHESDRLFGRALESERLLRQLYVAYQAMLGEAGQREGEDVPLRRLLKRLSAENHGLAADELNVDLARLVQSGQVQIDGRRLQLKPTRNARQGVLLHGLESGGYAGFLSFQREALS